MGIVLDFTHLVNLLCFRRILDCLDSNANVKHHCNVIFFTPGQYKLDVQCTSPESGALLGNTLGNIGHVWKFTPSLTMRVA